MADPKLPRTPANAASGASFCVDSLPAIADGDWPDTAALSRIRTGLFLRTWASTKQASVPWRIDGAICGTIPAELALAIIQHAPVPALVWDGNTLNLTTHAADSGAAANPDADTNTRNRHTHADTATRHLTTLARWIHQLGQSPDPDLACWARPWRGESLDVRAQPDGEPLASVDRSAVRALGVLTQSVRLNAWLPSGHLLLARRARNKRIDPGLWDNLTGGLIVAGEDPLHALLRETAEEAGLDLSQAWAHDGLSAPAVPMSVDRPIADGRLRERLHAFDLVLPASTRCANQDGEVDRFEAFTPVQALQAIENDSVSIEAALAIVDTIARRMP
jgi:8-oxo-dGTP pyrophosphatase MutT (NUDIX family)